MISQLVSQLPEVYQPIYGYPELSTKTSRTCTDRLEWISAVHDQLRSHLGRPVRVLDLGSSQGFFSLSLAARGAVVHGVDFLDKNVAVCKALAEEHPDFSCTFEVNRIEVVIDAMRPNAYDLVLGLSVFHHIAHEHGVGRVKDLFGRLALQCHVLVIELALREEPLYWAPSLPMDARSNLEQVAFVHEVARHHTHLADISRPLYVASNRFWFLAGELERFERFQLDPHELANNTHEGTRRYFFGDRRVLKQYLLQPPRDSFNRGEWEREVGFLKSPPKGFDAAGLVCADSNHAEAWTLMERLPGKTLLRLKLDKHQFDYGDSLVKLLNQLVALEEAGLNHLDVRIWNVLMDDHQQIRLIDYGSIDRSQVDLLWPFNIHLSFVLFVHEWMATEVDIPQPFRTVAFGAADLPEPFALWIRSLWELPMADWSFKAMKQRLERALAGELALAAPRILPQEVWAHAIEHAIQILKQHRNHFEHRTLALEEKQTGLNGQLRSLANRATEDVEHLSGQIRALEEHQRNTAHELAELRQLANLLAESHAQNAMMLNSRSWRWTAPLRWAILQVGLLRQHGLRGRMLSMLRKFGFWKPSALTEKVVPAPTEGMPASALGLPAPRYPGADAQQVLNDEALSTLARPAALGRPAPSAEQRPSEVEHEPLLHLSDLQEAPASIAVILLVGLADEAAIRRSVNSLLRQTDPAWELVFVVNEERAGMVDEWLDADWRIRRFLSHGGIGLGELQQAFSLATARFVGVLEAGDTLSEDLIRAFNEAAAPFDDVDVLFSDGLWQSSEGQTLEIRKPGWSPEQQTCVDALGRFCAIRKSLALSCHPWVSQHSCVVLYGLNLEAGNLARRHVHVPELLHVHHETTSTGKPGGFFPATAWTDLIHGIHAHLARIGVVAEVGINENCGSLLVKRAIPASTKVTVVILAAMRTRVVAGRGEILLAEHLVRSIIEKTVYPNYEIMLVDDGTTPTGLKDLLLENGHRWVSYQSEGPFSFARKANYGSRLAKEGVVVLLNDDMEVITPDWLHWMVSLAAQPAVGVVGAKLRFPDDTIQHVGMVMGMHGSCGHALHHLPDNGSEYLGMASVDRNCSAVTGAAMAYRTEVFESLGGFDETFRVDYNDIDFCLRCWESGLRVVLASQAMLYHFHNSSFQRPHDDVEERALFLKRWGHLLHSDPYFPEEAVKLAQLADTLNS